MQKARPRLAADVDGAIDDLDVVGGEPGLAQVVDDLVVLGGGADVGGAAERQRARRGGEDP